MPELLPEPPDPPLLVPPPELVQLLIAPAIANSSAIGSSSLRPRLSANGNSSSPHSIGSISQPPGLSSRAFPGLAVEIWISTFPVTPELTVVAAGLNRHNALAGSVPHANVKSPDTPLVCVIAAV